MQKYYSVATSLEPWHGRDIGQMYTDVFLPGCNDICVGALLPWKNPPVYRAADQYKKLCGRYVLYAASLL